MADPRISETVEIQTFVLKVTATDQSTRAKVETAQLKPTSRAGSAGGGVNLGVRNIYEHGEPVAFKVCSLVGDDASYNWVIRVFNQTPDLGFDIEMTKVIKSDYEIALVLLSSN